jgi:sugar lactone lactonase YvrE
MCSNNIKSTTSNQSNYEKLCSIPLGLRFHRKTGDLYIVDAYYRLAVVLSDGGFASPLTNHVDGKPILFENNLDVHNNGSIFFTDTST